MLVFIDQGKLSFGTITQHHFLRGDVVSAAAHCSSVFLPHGGVVADARHLQDAAAFGMY
jgi:hypothetical protein